MRAVIQRVKAAKVEVDNSCVGAIESGLLIYLGIEAEDTEEDIEWLSKKVLNLRIFNDENGQMNYSVTELEGKVLVISQFTLHAKTKKGNRPSFIQAAKPDIAEKHYLKFIEQLRFQSSIQVESGIFGADMEVSSINDGPVTLLIDTKNRE